MAACGNAGQGVAGTEPHTWPWRIFLPECLAYFVPVRLFEPLLLQRSRARQQFVEDDSKGIHVGSSVDIQGVDAHLLRRHVEWRADHSAERGVKRLFGKRMR